MKLITNFKKVRKLVKDPRITSYCLRHSQHLQVIKNLLKILDFGSLMSWSSAKDQFQLEINAWNTGNWATKCLRKFCPGLEITF